MFKHQQTGALRWSKLIIIFLLVLSISAAGQATPAKAAEPSRPQARTVTSVYLQIQMPKEPVCANKTSYILVRTVADVDILLKGGKADHVSADPKSGVTVTGSVSGSSIGTLHPTQLVSGDTELDNPGEATFGFDALKAGIAVVTFTPQYRGAKGKPEMKSIKVVNCDYKVTMNVTDIDSRSGVTIWIEGQLDTKITGESDALKGSAPLDMVSGFVGPPCTINYSDVQNPTTITGTINDKDQVELNFQYQPGQITENATCPGGGGTYTQQIDLTNTGIASATFPETGGTRMFRFTYTGSDMAPGTMIIDVQPIEAGG